MKKILFLLVLALYIPVVKAQKVEKFSWQDIHMHVDSLRMLHQDSMALAVVDGLLSRKNKIITKANRLRLLWLKARVLRSMGKLNQAMKVLDNAMAQNVQADGLAGDLWLEKAKIYREIGKKELAGKSLNKALIVFKKSGNVNGFIRTRILQNIISLESGSVHAALDSLKEIEGEITFVVDSSLSKELNFALAYAYFRFGAYDDAKKYFFKTLQFTPSRDLFYRNMLWTNLGTIYQRLGRADSACYYQRLAAKSALISKDYYLLPTLYYNLATLKLGQQDLDSTDFYARRGVFWSKRLKRYDRWIMNLQLLAAVDSIRGNTTGQLKGWKQIAFLKDSMLANERERISKEIADHYNSLKKDEIIALQKKNLKTARQKSLIQNILIFAGFLLLILLIIWLRTYRNLWKKKDEIWRFEQERTRYLIRQKNKELTSIALLAEQKARFVDDLYKRLVNIDKHSTGAKDQIKRIIREIKATQNLQRDIELFFEKFAQAHPDFISGLKKRFPQLSSSEIRLLSYIHVGMSNKQIAVMQNVTLSAVHKMRYRIKKKLGLPRNESLDDFVRKISQESASD